MDSRSTVVSFASLGTILSIVLFSAPHPSSPRAPAPVAAAALVDAPLRERDETGRCAGAPGAVRGHGCRLLEEYLGAPAGRGAVAEELDVVIATLPDPVDSHLDWAYDLYLESLRRAFETNGFITDRFWLPGRRDTVAVPIGGGRDSATPAPETMVLPAREVYPGVILFRNHDPSQPGLRLLYVVNETPTGGVYKQALRNALEEREQLLRRAAAATDTTKCDSTRARASGAGSERADTVKIVGPVFSGSAQSLARVLGGWLSCDASRYARIVTGAATDTGSWTLLARVPAAQPRTLFHSTVIPDVRMMEVLEHDVLGPLGIRGEEVVLLREASTQYGRPAGGTESSFVVVPFPMNISSLRTEYARNPAPTAQGQLPQVEVERPRIPLSLLDSVRPRESPPVHSNLTAPAVDLVLEEISRALRSHSVRAVGILATDIRDKLFLGKFIRERLHGVQFFTFESNALYLRRDYSDALRGMIVLSSYPLVLDEQWWVQPGGSRSSERLAFPTDAAQGIYNAALLQLGDSASMVGYGTAQPPEYGDKLRPPVWVSVVGARSFLPLRARWAGAASPYVYGLPRENGAERAATPRRASRPPITYLEYGAWIVLGLAITLISLWIFLMRRRDRERDRTELEGGAPPGAGPPVAACTEVPPEPPSSGGGVAVSSEVASPGASQRPARGSIRLASGGREYRRIAGVSLRLHREIYTLLLLAALAGLFLPAASLIWKSVLLVGPLTEMALPGSAAVPGGVAVWLFGWAAVLVGVAVWLCAFGDGFRRGCSLLAREWRSGLEYAFRSGWKSDKEGWFWMLEVAARFVVVAIGILYLASSLWYAGTLLALPGADTFEFHLFMLRGMQLESGVSPVPPLFLTGAGLAVWSTWHIQRVGLLIRRSTPYEEACLKRVAEARDSDKPVGRETPDQLCARICGREVLAVEEVRRRLSHLFPDVNAIVLALCLLCVIVWPMFRIGKSLELLAPGGGGAAFVVLFGFGITASLSATAWGVYRLVAVWRELERFLEVQETSGLREAFGRIPPHVAKLARLTVLDTPARATVRAAEATQWHQLHRTMEEADREQFGHDWLALCDISREGHELFQDGSLVRGGTREFERRADVLARLRDVLRRLQEREPTRSDIQKVVDELSTRGHGDGRDVPRDTSTRLRRAYTGPLGLWIRIAEELLAVTVIDYIEWVVRHLRRLAFFLLLSVLLATALLGCYPFPSQAIMKLIFFITVGATIAALITIINQMSRNDLLSRITSTTPGRITWDLTYISNILLFIGIPVLTVISAEFPGVRSVLFAWVEPLLRTITRS